MKVGVDIGGSHVGIGVVNETNEIIESYEKDYTDDEKKDLLHVILNYIIETVNKIKEKYEVESIGIAVPGAVKEGVILRTINLGVNNFNIAGELKKIFDCPILVRNDGKCACLVEYNKLTEEDETFKDKNMLFLNIGTGIGGGVIHNGKLLQGNIYEGFEMGHMIININGIQCNCGKKGCFEKYGNILQYKNKVRERLNISKDINGDELRAIMNSRKEEIEDLKQEYISNLSIGISNLINVFEPDVIVLGGGFSRFAYMLIDDLKNKLTNSELLFNKRNEVDIRIAKLKNDAGIIGATL